MTDNLTPSPRAKLIPLFLGAVAVAGLAYFVYYLSVLRYRQDTDDAYVAGDVITITSEVPGTVRAIKVDDTESVKVGQLLVELDARDTDLELEQAEAQLARAVRNYRSMKDQVQAATSEAQSRKIDLTRLEQDYTRRQPLKADGAVANEELAHAAQSLEAARQAVATAEAKAASISAMLAKGDVVNQPDVAQAIARYKVAFLAKQRSQILAPAAGVIAKRSVQVGTRIQPGTPLMAVVPLEQAWVDANFREVDLKAVRIGQPALVHADLYGSDVSYHAHVAGLSAGTGGAFSLLPAQNASGNWIKIVQRVPVRVVFDDTAELKAHPLRMGLSMRVQIDTHNQSGELVTNNSRGTLNRPELAVTDEALVQRKIQGIIHDNLS